MTVIAKLANGYVDKDSGYYWISTQNHSLRIDLQDAKALAFAILEDRWAHGRLSDEDCQRLTNMAIGD